MRSSSTRRGPWPIALSALVAAGAALLVPGSAGTTSAAATCLAVGALALLAGHTWGLLVVFPAHVALVGRLWPVVALSSSSTMGTGEVAAIAVVLATFVPTLALSAFTLPAIVGHLLPDRSPRARSLVVATGAVLLAATLVLPAITGSTPSRALQAAQPAPDDGASAVIVGGR